MVLPSSGDNFPHLIQKRRSQLGFVTHLLTYLRNKWNYVAALLMYVHDVHKDNFTFTVYLSCLKNSSFILKYFFISKERKMYLQASVHIKRNS